MYRRSSTAVTFLAYEKEGGGRRREEKGA